MENGKFSKIFGIIFTMTGVLGIAMGVVFLVYSQKTVPGEEEVRAAISDITATKINNKYNHHVYIDYNYQGVEYKHVSINFYSSSMRIGDIISVKIDPANPDNPYDRSKLILGFFIGAAIGLVFLCIGLPFWIIGARTSKEIERLTTDGKVITCLITDITIGNSSVNNIRAKKVRCRNIDSVLGNEEYISKNIYLPDDIMPSVGDAVCVYVDRKDSSRYYVEVK